MKDFLQGFLMITECARAKVNLTLRVTGRREDGYHLLHSLVVFPEVSDRLTFERSDELHLSIGGPRSRDLEERLDPVDNLVLRAAMSLQKVFGITQGARITLEKNLPAAAGIGGGSADAAAALRGLLKLWSLRPDETTLLDIALGLGADVPVCLSSRSTIMSGIGEVLQPVSDLAPHWLVLVNCGRPVPTGAVFASLKHFDIGEVPSPVSGEVSSFSQLTEYLTSVANDLQAPAVALEPGIQDCLDALSACPNVALVRMSGSGATCFGLFEHEGEAREAERMLTSKHSEW